VDDISLYATYSKDGYVVGKLQRRLDFMVAWYEHWNIKIKEDKSREIYSSHRRAHPFIFSTLNGLNTPFVSNANYLGVIFHKRNTWRLHMERIEVKAFRTFIRIYSLFKSED
jgi:hypothetical protein